MTPAPAVPSAPVHGGLSAAVRAAVCAAPLLSGLAVALALLALPTLAAMAVDDCLHRGVSIWTKPLKFEIALALYAGTLALFSPLVPEAVRRATWFRLWVVAGAVAILGEMTWIGGAAAAGTASHFNVADPTMAALYSLAGVGAVLLTSLTLAYGVAIARNRESGLPPALHLSVVLGLLATFPLTLLTAGTLAAGTGPFVGPAPTEAHGIFFFGWSTAVGDLRFPHFLATHAMHAIPLAGLAAARLPAARGRVAVTAAAALYGLLVLGAFAEALAGRPPGETLAALFG